MKPSVPLILSAGGALAVLDVNLGSPDSIKKAARQVVDNLLSYYHGNETGQIPGVLPTPSQGGEYYWWESGAMWGTLIDYWHYTGDATYNGITSEGLQFQSVNSFQPDNWTLSLGNDDQGMWGMSAMLAAETNFPDPPKDKPQWLALAQGVFNTQASRWDDEHCNGGMRWQAIYTNPGYNYKNSIANGIFFNLGARLARYTGNTTYSDWATKTWDWEESIGFMTPDYNIYDGADIDTKCKGYHKEQYSYNAAVFIQGAAFMYNYTNGSDIWRKRVNGLVNRTIELFFPDGILLEISCELPDRLQCNVDQRSFKGYMHRWLASAVQVAPIIREPIMKALRSSAAAAVKSCNGPVCGFRWNKGSYDGQTGAGQQMSMTAALSTLLVDQDSTKEPSTSTTGGTSKGDPNAGGSQTFHREFAPITKGDQAGAGILTTLVLAGVVFTCYWLLSGRSEDIL